MTTKKLNRYYCDFCGKSGGSAGHMKNHEAHCTLNPNRQCRLCNRLQQTPKPIEELKALLPVMELEEINGYDQFSEASIAALKAAVPVLRDACGGCPACMMAALRQKGIPVPVAEGFDYATESKQVLNDTEPNRDWVGVY